MKSIELSSFVARISETFERAIALDTFPVFKEIFAFKSQNMSD